MAYSLRSMVVFGLYDCISWFMSCVLLFYVWDCIAYGQWLVVYDLWFYDVFCFHYAWIRVLMIIMRMLIMVMMLMMMVMAASGLRFMVYVVWFTS